MKKNLLIIPLTAIALVACAGGNNGNNDNSSQNVVKKDLKEDFLKDMETIRDNENYSAKAYYSFVNGDNTDPVPCGVLEQYNKKSVLWVDEKNPANSIGVLSNGSNGLFEYTLNQSGEVVLGDFVNFDGGYSVGQYFDAPAGLMDTEKWTLAYDETCFECRDDDIIALFVSLAELNTVASQTGARYTYGLIRGKYDETGNMYFALNGAKGDTASIRGELYINKINETRNEKVEEYVKNEHQVNGPTSWTKEQQAIITTYFGGANAEPLPFPEGASYALKVQALSDYSEAMITDIACGDISKAYAAKLEAEGFKVTNTGEYYYCSKALTKGSANYTFEVYVSYYTVADITTNFGKETAKFYPKGRFQIEIMASKTTNSTMHNGSLAEFEAWLDENAKFNFPRTGWTDVLSVTYADRTETYNAVYAAQNIVYKSVTSVKFYIDNEQSAINDYNSYESKLLGLGYEKTEQREGNLLFVYFINGKNEVDLSINYSNGQYGGFIQAMYWVEE